MHHQQDIFKMGGLFRSLPLTSTFLLIGLLALVAFPGSSGFFSKEAILMATYEAHTAGPTLWWIGVFGAFLTSLYSFRLLFIVCFGPANHHHKEADYTLSSQFVVPLLPLVTLAVVGGFISLDFNLVFGPTQHPYLPLWIEWMPVAVALVGFILAWVLYFPRGSRRTRQPSSGVLSDFCRDGLGFDWLYERLFTKPLQFFARVNKNDVIDHVYHFVGWFNLSLNEILVISQNGKLRWYLFGTLAGCAMMLGGLVWWH
jgi:NADH-quinone oxidoreductase subunit L